MKLSSFLLIFVSLLLSACGAHKRATKNKDIEAFSAELSKSGETLNDKERAVLMRICYSFRSKHTQYRTSLLNKNFLFSTSQNTCANATVEQRAISAKLIQSEARGALTFGTLSSNPFLNFYTKVNTHIDGHLRTFCERTFRGLSASNTVYNGATGDLLEFSFYEDDNDVYQIRYGRQELVNGKYSDEFTVYQVERFFVQTDPGPSGIFYGLVSRYEKRELCPENSIQDFKSYNQIYQKLTDDTP